MGLNNKLGGKAWLSQRNAELFRIVIKEKIDDGKWDAWYEEIYQWHSQK